MSNPTQVYLTEKEDAYAKVFALEEFKWAVGVLEKRWRKKGGSDS